MSDRKVKPHEHLQNKNKTYYKSILESEQDTCKNGPNGRRNQQHSLNMATPIYVIKMDSFGYTTLLYNMWSGYITYITA